MANKVRFGLANVKYAILSEGTYGDPVALPGAVSLTTSRQGEDSDFYADDGVHFTFANNNGYDMELEIAYLSDEARIALLGEVVDSANGIQLEVAGGSNAHFALIFETQGDDGPVSFCYYDCQLTRPEMSANTKGENPDVDTQTLNIRTIPREFTVLGEKQKVVQSHITKTSENATKYTAFHTGVVIPTASAISA